MIKPDHHKIFRYFDGDHLDKVEAPSQVNYKTELDQRLFPIITWDKGRILYVDYYASASLDASGEEVGNDLIVREHFSYTDDAAGLARHRVMTITWYREDGSAGGTKIREKLYNNSAARTEGRRRRRNVIDQLTIKVVGMVAATQTAGDVAAAMVITVPWLEAKATEVQQFIETSAGDLKTAVYTDTEAAWLDNLIAPGVTIRMFVLGEL